MTEHPDCRLEAVQRVGVPDTSVPFAPAVEDEVLPGPEEVGTAIRRTL